MTTMHKWLNNLIKSIIAAFNSLPHLIQGIPGFRSLPPLIQGIFIGAIGILFCGAFFFLIGAPVQFLLYIFLIFLCLWPLGHYYQRERDQKKALEWASTGRPDNLQYVYLQRAKLAGVDLGPPEKGGRGADLSYATLKHADLRDAILEKVDLRGANLERANLSRARITESNLRDANLCRANLQGVTLRDTDLQGANLTWTDLRGICLVDANLKDANLRCANLSHTNLEGIDLWNANLHGARLLKAILRNANLGSANLQGADLQDADLRGTDLRNANLGGAQLRKARHNGSTRWPKGFKPPRDAVLDLLEVLDLDEDDIDALYAAYEGKPNDEK